VKLLTEMFTEVLDGRNAYLGDGVQRAPGRPPRDFADSARDTAAMEAPGGGEDFERGGWSFAFDQGEDGAKLKLDETLDAEAMLPGRVTYERFAGLWPSQEGGFADKLSTMPKYAH
jgi:hypothetical protein